MVHHHHHQTRLKMGGFREGTLPIQQESQKKGKFLRLLLKIYGVLVGCDDYIPRYSNVFAVKKAKG